MLREGEGIAARALSDAGIDYHPAREVIGILEDRRALSESGSQPFSRVTMRIMERALQLSWAQAEGDIGTEHLLQALLERNDDTVENVLAELDVTPQEVMLRVDAAVAERGDLMNPVLVSPGPSALALARGSDRVRRLEVLEGVLWGIDHLEEVVELLRGSANRRVAREALMAPPYELSQNEATGVLDLSVESVTADRRKQVIEEVEMLRHDISSE
jgi:hypothetical protein